MLTVNEIICFSRVWHYNFLSRHLFQKDEAKRKVMRINMLGLLDTRQYIGFNHYLSGSTSLGLNKTGLEKVSPKVLTVLTAN